jgi:rare lipoprotein A (peptidoglycan hydrolase)
MIAAASDGLWDNGAACGRMYQVSCAGGTNATPNPCKGGSVTVKIVDRCPSPGCQATLDLSQEAFNTIGNLDAGKILINYNQYARATRFTISLPLFTRLCFFFKNSFF